ncbi:putative DNA repair protein RAD51-like protein [Cricetulus griseus]|nr:putative DNA repair protein RAD51-like protein [Cricetulus griseus]
MRRLQRAGPSTSSSGTVKVVIVDSVTAVIAPLLGGQQREGLALMMQLARELKILARDLAVAVVGYLAYQASHRPYGNIDREKNHGAFILPSSTVAVLLELCSYEDLGSHYVALAVLELTL